MLRNFIKIHETCWQTIGFSIKFVNINFRTQLSETGEMKTWARVL